MIDFINSTTHKMKIKKAALVYSGQPRHLKECYANHWATFHEVNPDWEIDVFGHLWYDDEWEKHGYQLPEHTTASKEDKEKIEQEEHAKGSAQLSADLKNFIKERWCPKKIVFEKPRRFEIEGTASGSKTSKPRPGRTNPINNTLSMFYSMERANNFKKEYEEEQGFKYDCVIRLRTDSYFPSPLGCCTTTIGGLDEYNLKKINVHHQRSFDKYPSGAMCDQFAFAESEVMDKFTMLFTNIENLLNRVDNHHVHHLLSYHTKAVQGLSIEQHGWLRTLWRSKNSIPNYYPRAEHIEHLCDARRKSLENMTNEDTVAKNEVALIWLSGGSQKISMNQVSDLFRLYKDILPEPTDTILGVFKDAIKNDAENLTHRPFQKVEKSLLSYYWKRKLKVYERRIKKTVRREVR